MPALEAHASRLGPDVQPHKGIDGVVREVSIEAEQLVLIVQVVQIEALERHVNTEVELLELWSHRVNGVLGRHLEVG